MKTKTGRKVLKLVYEPPMVMTEDSERGLERAYDFLFQETLKVWRAQKAKCFPRVVKRENPKVI